MGMVLLGPVDVRRACVLREDDDDVDDDANVVEVEATPRIP